jgi:hypothetical protein
MLIEGHIQVWPDAIAVGALVLRGNFARLSVLKSMPR